jgi:hypothetical protein
MLLHLQIVLQPRSRSLTVAHHPPQITFASKQMTLGGRCAWALLGSAFLKLILTDDICKD